MTLNAPGEQGLNPDAPKGENFPMTVKLPADMNCKGGMYSLLEASCPTARQRLILTMPVRNNRQRVHPSLPEPLRGGTVWRLHRDPTNRRQAR